ncbi:MAG: Uma2 family endonuclease [Polyangiales bacterium]
MASSIPSRATDFGVDGPDITHLITEDDTPVDNVYSEKQQRVLPQQLNASWEGPPPEDGEVARPFVVMANVGVYATARESPLVPDVLLAVDVRIPEDIHEKKNRCYLLWEYGKAPDVVIEVVSNREGGELTERKRRYRKMRVAYYVVWDPEGHLSDTPLQVFELRGQLYVRSKRAWFESLGIGLTVWEGTFEGVTDRWLRWCDRSGKVIPTGEERARAERERADAERGRADAERERADAERERADAERERADAERERAEKLAARLRALGVDPEG